MSNFDEILAVILKHEGGYVDHPDDPGGATNYGITHRTLGAYLGRDVTKRDVREVSPETVKAIYQQEYWDKIQGDRLLNRGVALVLFDYAVNSGVSRAVLVLQRIVGVTPDGTFGSITLRNTNSTGPGLIIDAITEERRGFLRRLKTYKTFGKGWEKRVTDVYNRAVALNKGRNLDPLPKPTVTTGKAREKDVALTKTTQGQAGIVAGAGSAGAIITEAADKIAPLGEISTIFKIVFAVLTIAGVVIMLWPRIKPLLEPKPKDAPE